MPSLFTPAHRGGSGPPLVCLHGFTDTWRTWELILPALERRHDVLAPTLAGHAGGPPIGEVLTDRIVDAAERSMDEAGFATAHLVGNSLGAYVALRLAQRGRAETVVALAPAGGWAPDDPAIEERFAYFEMMQEMLKVAAPQAHSIVATDRGRRRATAYTSVNYEHIPPELLAHQMCAVAACDPVGPFVEQALRLGWPLEPERIDCPVRVVWGTEDRLLEWPRAAERYRREWLPHADWVELDGVGHCPQLDVPLETAQLILGFTAG